MTSSQTVSRLEGGRDIPQKRAPALDLTPALVAFCYPFLLDAFHFVVGPPGALASTSTVIAAALVLACILAVPTSAVVFATRAPVGTGARRLAYACVAAPTIYVFLGVVQGMAESIVPDELLWCPPCQ